MHDGLAGGHRGMSQTTWYGIPQPSDRPQPRPRRSDPTDLGSVGPYRQVRAAARSSPVLPELRTARRRPTVP
jgi:hypothetical protein